MNTDHINKHESIIGVDESGKGDFFGPLVTAAVYVATNQLSLFQKYGVRDSKLLTENSIKKTALWIKENSIHSIVYISNQKYNELYDKIRNLNRLLAWAHARAIENVLEQIDCATALSDQFGKKELIEQALLEKGKRVTLLQTPRAERHVAVAAASIVARASFLEAFYQFKKQYHVTLPRGASKAVIQSGIHFVNTFGKDELKAVAKLHFKTTKAVLER